MTKFKEVKIRCEVLEDITEDMKWRYQSLVKEVDGMSDEDRDSEYAEATRYRKKVYEDIFKALEKMI